jgi:pimeloyl-ACP methyl ester carboxylesterase
MPTAGDSPGQRTYVLLPGAGGAATWYWQRVTALLREAGHEVIPVDLPGADPAAGLPEYARIVVDAIGGRRDVVLVAASLGGFTAPMVAAAVPVAALVFVNAMIPEPGEKAGDWWRNTGQRDAMLDAAERGGYPAEFDVETYFLHDVPAEILASPESQEWPEADVVFESACAFSAWPDVPIRVVAGADDRLFPAEFQRRVARERLGVEADVLPGGHLMTLAHPDPLARYLLSP